MKPVKAWETLRAWQEEGRKCRPADVPNVGENNFDVPMKWTFWFEREFEIEPPKPKIVEFTSLGAKAFLNDMTQCQAVIFDCEPNVAKDLNGKRWRVICTEIVE